MQERLSALGCSGIRRSALINPYALLSEDKPTGKQTSATEPRQWHCDPPCMSSGVVSSCAATGGRAAARFRGDLRLATLVRLSVRRPCTGEPFYEMLKAELPKKVIRSYTGTKLVFGT